MCTPSRATWWRWKSGRQTPPLAVVNLLRIVVKGELPQGGEPWGRWRFFNGRLYDPAGYEHTPGSIESWFWTRQRLDALRYEQQRPTTLPPNVARLPTAADAITEELHKRLRVEK